MTSGREQIIWSSEGTNLHYGIYTDFFLVYNRHSH